ncbi:Peflin [Cladophialophora carrionii]|uniref:Peflin n=1 Tax=Cladophialophora carrionii TaxID=86049 RepID=A0A1C1CLH5_9EURO|nr:Peflin [Cladophialophora carrionii]
MAYNKAFNPDALPAHAEPEQAAQALSQLEANRQHGRPSPNQPPLGPNAAAGWRPSPSPIPQNSYRPSPIQTYPQQRPPPNQQYGDSHYDRLQSPPPTSYGYGYHPQADPAGMRRTSNEATQYGGRTPAPPDPVANDLQSLFRAANVSCTGSLTTTELGSALVNADFTPFDARTITSLMAMFTNSPPKQPQGPTITFPEFENLWRFLAAWRTLFERFDEDGSGRISLNEFSKAMTAFGYRLSPPFVNTLYNAYNDRSAVQDRGMSFDLFVQSCISLKRMTDVFKRYDDDRDGYVTMSFEEFLTEILRLRD